MEKGLSVQGVSVGMYKETLVEEVSFNITESTCLTLIGESGSGKTLTGLAIGGLLPERIQVQKGKILLNSESINNKSSNRLKGIRGRRIAYIFQNYASTFSPQIKLDKQLHETLSAHYSISKEDQIQTISDALDEVGLSYELIKSKYSFQLSGGQLQRVSIAAAIMLKPQIIIADEPTTALDPDSSIQILNLLKQLKIKISCSILLITHDLAIAREYADEIAVMHNGSIVEHGLSREILEHPKHPYTRELISAEKSLDFNYEKLNQSEKEKSVSGIKNIVEVRNLEKKFGKGQILKDVCFEIREGECVGLIGKSGCGKSTVARCLLQLDTYDAGEIYYKNKHIIGRIDKEESLGKIQAVFQHPSLALNNRLKVLDSLMEPLDIVKRDFRQKRSYRKKRMIYAEELLIQVGLSPELLFRYPHELSGGQKQRVCIARAISTEPKLLVLDEPTASLDMLVQAQIIRLLKDLQRKIGYSSLIISHDYRSLNVLSDRILNLRDGKIHIDNQ